MVAEPALQKPAEEDLLGDGDDKDHHEGHEGKQERLRECAFELLDSQLILGHSPDREEENEGDDLAKEGSDREGKRPGGNTKPDVAPYGSCAKDGA